MDLCEFFIKSVANLAEVLSMGAVFRVRKWLAEYVNVPAWLSHLVVPYSPATIFLTGVGSRTIGAILGHAVGVCPGSQNNLSTKLPGANPRYDQVCFLTAHNAFAHRTDYRVNFAQQTYDLSTQLAMGVRGLMLDIYNFQPPGLALDFYLCHEGCSNVFTMTGKVPQTLRNALATVVNFLINDPQAIITLFFENRLGLQWMRQNLNGMQQRMKQIFATTGADKYLFRPDQINQPNGQTWNFAQQGWPPIQWMQQYGCRLVVFSDRAAEWGGPSGGPPVRDPKGQYTAPIDDSLPYLWEYVVETGYGDASLSGPFDQRDGSAPLNDTTKSLFLQNYFPSLSAGGYLTGVYYETNDSQKIRGRTVGYSHNAKRCPNFLAVDFFQIGENGGPPNALSLINDDWLTGSC